MAAANWMCNQCFIVLEAEDEGQTELCPICDLEMEEVFLMEDT